MKKVILTIVGLAATVCVNGQNSLQTIDSLVTQLYNEHELSGNILIADHGHVIYQRSLGYADAGRKILNNQSNSFQIASVSKTFTSVAILQLLEKGKLKLDDPVSKYLSDFPFDQITIRGLLSHTSGLNDYQVFQAPYRANPNKIYTNADIIPAIKNDRQAILAKPGEIWSYSNIGFSLLAMIVERISGISFPDYLDKFILKPAGMTHTYISSSLKPSHDKDSTLNYDFVNYDPGRLKNVDSIPGDKVGFVILRGVYGCNNIVSTTEDMLRFDQALYTSKLLRSSTLKQAFVPEKLNGGKPDVGKWNDGTTVFYGLGWGILCDTSMGQVVYHTGGMPGASTVFIRNISHDQTIIVLDNVTHYNVRVAGFNMLRLLNNQSLHNYKLPLARLFAEDLIHKRTDYALAHFNELKSDTAHYYLDEGEMNSLGYAMLNDSHASEALEVIRLNTILFPASWNTYDSYADMLAKAGKKEEAIMMYKKAVQMNPKDDDGKQALKQLTAN
ncbi:MAG: beta-lactamase family protein [Bacteroidetes bacterium]|nr:beta-lactamase family protein [Bacteroidota bacterium]